MKTYIYYHQFDKSMRSHDLIKIGLQQYFYDIGSEEICETLTICAGKPHNKPYFLEYPKIYHNVSHSGDWWVCAYGTTENGLDLQKVQDKKVEKIAKRFFHPREVEWLQGKEQKEFFRLWAYNESYVKYVGDGLTQGLTYFSVVPEQAETESVDDEADFKLGVKKVCQQEIPFVEKEYWLVVTTKEKEKIIFKPLDMGYRYES